MINSELLLGDLSKRIMPLASTLNNSQLTDLVAVINQEIITRRYKFYGDQRVMVRKFAGDYHSNYSIAKVIMANKYYVFVTGLKNEFTGQFMHTSVMSMEEWEKKEKWLKYHRRMIDPQYESYFGKIKTKQVATIDPISLKKRPSRGRPSSGRKVIRLMEE